MLIIDMNAVAEHFKKMDKEHAEWLERIEKEKNAPKVKDPSKTYCPNCDDDMSQFGKDITHFFCHKCRGHIYQNPESYLPEYRVKRFWSKEDWAKMLENNS